MSQPYQGVKVLTKDDTIKFPATRGLYVGGAGAVAVTMFDGTTAVFAAVPVGTTLPIAVTQLLSTGTAATLVIALY